MAVFGLSSNDTKGASDSSASISADREEASSAIAPAETPEGSITKPEVEAKATTDSTNIDDWGTVAGSNGTLTFYSCTITNRQFSVYDGQTITVNIPYGVTVTFAGSTTIWVNKGGGLRITGGGVIKHTGTNSICNIDGGGTLWFNPGNNDNVSLFGGTSEYGSCINVQGANSKAFLYKGALVGGNVYAKRGALRVNSSGSASAWTGFSISGCNSSFGALYVGSGATMTFYGTPSIHDNKGQQGGGVYIQDGTFTMYGGNIYNNSANNGGGVMLYSGTFNMSGGTISGNSAPRGAGVRSGGVFNMSGGTITGHNSDFGAGVYVNGNTLTMSGNAAITNNTAKSGGGIYLSEGAVNMSGNADISGNKSTSGNGGGVFAADGTSYSMTGGTVSNNTSSNWAGAIYGGGNVTVSGGTISGNIANYGGAIFFNGKDNTHLISGGTFSGNEAKISGGAIYAYANPVFSGGIISGNKAKDNGGAICMESGTLTMNKNTGTSYITANTATNGAGVAIIGDSSFNMTGGYLGVADNPNIASNVGGGVFISTSGTFTMSLTVDGCISYNQAVSGGGVYVEAGTFVQGTPIASGTSGTAGVGGNKATGNGGGVYVAGGTYVLNGTGTTVWNNVAINGGGVFVAGGTFNFGCGTIHSNLATTNGGGVYYVGGTFTTTADSHIGYIDSNGAGGNTANVNGGGLFVENGNTTFNGWIQNNVATSGTHGGGGVYIHGGTFTLSSTGHIDTNAAVFGGGVYYAGGTFNLNSGNITNNQARGGNGGGIFTVQNLTLSSGVISGNMTTTGAAGGGGIFIQACTLTINSIYVNIYNNSSPSGYGGGICVTGNLVFSSGYIYGNSAAYGGGVAILGDSIFTMIGGVIGTSNSPNSATSLGGGVFLQSTGTHKISGGTIQFNSAVSGGGVCVYSTTTLTIQGAIICDNKASDQAGGLFIGGGGVVHFSAGRIFRNTATYNGGGVAIGGTLNLSGTAQVGDVNGEVLYGNKAVRGGGIYVAGGTVNQTGGKVLYNVAEGLLNYSSGNGGGVYVGSGAYNLSGGSIEVNDSMPGTGGQGYGGGVHMEGGTFTMTNGTVRANRAANIGGGFYLGNSAAFTMSGGTIGGVDWGNEAPYGGGIYVNTTGDVTFSGGTISYNEASGNGGGIYLDLSKKATAARGGSGVDILANKAVNGGGVFISGSSGDTVAKFTFNAGTIRQNTVTGCGGGVFLNGTKALFEMNGGTIGGSSAADANKAVYGGGIFSDTGVTHINGGRIAYNWASYNGGGISSEGSFIIDGEGIQIDHNTASQYGGGIFMGGTGSITGGTDEKIPDREVIITFNAASSGAGIFVGAGGTLDVNDAVNINSNSTLLMNSSTESGGGICVITGTLNFNGGIVSGNTAYYGGGIAIGSNGTATMAGGELTGNAGLNYGGGVYLNDGTFNMNGGKIINGVATHGGGIYANGVINMTAGTISNNEAKTGNGGGIFFDGSADANIKAVISGGEISANTAVKGGGVYIQGGTLGIKNATVTANVVSTPCGAGVYLGKGLEGVLELGGVVVINDNLYRDTQNNVWANNTGCITFSSALAEGAKIGIVAKDNFVLTNGFTAAGHTEADIEKYFSPDFHGVAFDYVDQEIVVSYDIVLAWNETVTASHDNNSTELFVLYKNWEAENNSFGTGFGFRDGSILVPADTDIIFDFNGFNVDGKGSTISIMKVDGNAAIEFVTDVGGAMKGGSAQNGAALYISGTVTLTNGTICDNEASYGAAAYITNGGSFVMNGGSLVRNSAENGAAVYVNDGTFTFAGGVIGGKQEDANVASSYGGAVYVSMSGNLEVNGGEISYNKAQSGGAVYVYGGNFNTSDGLFKNNEASRSGGAVYVDNGNVELSGGIFGGDTTYANANVAEDGGAIYVASGTVNLTGAEIGGNKASFGAGVYVAGGEVIMVDGTIYHNLAENEDGTAYGGGAYVTGAASQFTISGGSISENVADKGLGVYVAGGALTVAENGAIEHQSGENAIGAGVYLDSGMLTVSGGYIGDNGAKEGAGVYMTGGTFNMTGGEIATNGAVNGTGVYAAGGTFNLSGGKVSSNNAEEGGAGVYINGGSFNLTANGLINNNYAYGVGGGVCMDSGSLSINGGKITENGGVEYGGGVFIAGGTAEIKDGEIALNEADRYGGGVSVYNVKLTISGGNIHDNTSTSGGGAGVYVSGELEMKGGLITKNNTDNNGGGVFVDDGSFTMTDGKITENTATGNGAGVYFRSETKTLTLGGGEISANKAAMDGGGGVWIQEGTFEMSDGLISGNSGIRGAGVYVASPGAFNMTGGEISGNTGSGASTTYGGGVYVDTALTNEAEEGAGMTMSGTAKITGNTAVRGGGIYVDEGSALTVSGGTISENTASSGGGVYILCATADITGGLITKNNSDSVAETDGGAGMFVSNGSTVTVSGTAKITENTSARYGGGIRVDGSVDTTTVEISDGLVNGNAAVTGGGAYVTGNFATLTFSGSSMVSENTASTNGGGVAALGGAVLNVSGVALLTKNTASSNGGGVYLSDAGTKLNVTDKGSITYNTANYGGGVYATTGSTFTMASGSVSHNSATTSGGAVYVTSATFALEDGQIVGNSAGNGGAIFVASGANSVFKMTGGAIGGEEENDANTAAVGGGVYIAGGSVTVTSGAISFNEATTNGGGVYFNAGTLSIEGNPVINNNTFEGSASNLYLYNGKTITVIGKLTEGANIGLTGTGKATDGYQANGNGETEKAYFFGDVVGSVIAVVGGEIHIQISLEDSWNAAVQASLDNGGSAVTFVLAESWRADNGAFGDDAGVGFTNGGALYLPEGAYVVLNLNEKTINRNLTASTTLGSVFYVAGKLEISGTLGIITGGYTDNGGGVHIQDGGYVKLAVGYIQNNTAKLGGGVYVESGATFELAETGTVRNNTATELGGGVYVEDGGTFNMAGGAIGGASSANNAKNGAGVYSLGAVKMTGGNIRNNAATELGGGLYVAGGEAIAKGGYIGGTSNGYANTAVKGAGVYVENGTFTLDGATVAYNATTDSGAGVYAAGGEVIIENGAISSNASDKNVGGVYVGGDATFTMNGGEISSNKAADSYAGLYLCETGTGEINGGKISNNAAAKNGVGIGVASELTINGGSIIGNGTNVQITADGACTMNDGTVSGGNNTVADNAGGVAVNGTFEMNGGTISGNSSDIDCGGVAVRGATSSFNMTGGTISGNSGWGGVRVEDHGTFEMTGGSISDNLGSGINLYLGTVTMDGGEISGNTNSGVNLEDATFIMNGGEISGNTSSHGGGIYAYYYTTTEINGGVIKNNTATSCGGGIYSEATYNATQTGVTMNGGEISGNSAPQGGGVYVLLDFAMTGGEISGNTANEGAGVYVAVSGTFDLTGGRITGNRAEVLGGGVYVAKDATLNVSGSPIVSGNTANGAENNVYLTADQVIIITGLLSVNGMIAWLGVSMYDPKRFTNGFATNNAYNPALKPDTVFFSDDTDYMVKLDADGEVTLAENDYSQSSLVWQISKDGGNTWISIDTPYYSLKYKKDEEYTVRARNAQGADVPFTWATDGENNDITSTFKGIGSYKFVINSDEYVNPSLTVEILPATLYWQYSTDEGQHWYDLTVDTLVYTGATYQIRTGVYNGGFEVVKEFTETMKDVGEYEYAVEENLYENPTLNFSITTRYIDVEWNFGDALGDATNGYYWEYDGFAHAPVAILNGVSGELAGTDLTYSYSWSGGNSFGVPQNFAGTYTLKVSLPDDNVVLSNTTVEYKINGAVLSLVWTDENGNVGDEFTYEYDHEKHGVNFILSGVVTGDTVEPYVTYVSRNGKELSEAPTAVGYYTATVKLPANCYSYVFDKTYTCQIVITKKTIAVEWTPNADGTFVWTFNGLGKGPVASIINPYTGEQLNEAYTVEYAPVASNGNIGQYTPTQPVNAGNYIVKVTLNNPDANYVLDESTVTQNYKIAQLGVNITWKGATYDADKNVYFWSYDGEEHGLEAEINLSGVDVYKNGVIISSLEIERTDAQTKLVSVGSATATVVLLNNAFNANFVIENSTTQVYEVRKAVIDTVSWTDKFKQEYATGDTATFDFGTVTGVNGPEFEALGNGKVSLVVTYSKSYEGDWVVDEVVGYTAYAKLSAEDKVNYELADGAEYFSLQFFIKSVGGFKQDIDVTWVVFINEFDYVALDQYLADGGFVYNGKVQHPTPIYLKENGVDYEILELNPSSVGSDAGLYTARLKPSSVYNIKEEDFTCDYEINKLDVTVSWQDAQYDSNKTFTYVYNGSEQAPYAFVAGNYDFEIGVTVTGKVNAGTYTAIAELSDNFNIVGGATQDYTISKLGIDAGRVVWDYSSVGASGDEENGWYWVYDGEEHAPKATITLSSLDITIEFVVTGATSEIGAHTAYAVLNSSNPEHNNFYLTGTTSTTFEIVQVKAGQVYWKDADGHVYEDGAAGDTGLTFTYDGKAEGQAPKAYYVDDEGNEVYLTVTVIGGTAVNAGSYSAYVSSELDFATTIPTCTFVIKPMEITVTWDDATTLTFNGKEQSPAVTLSEGADGYVLADGVDYEVKGFTKAGKYTAEIKFLNNNYACAEENATFDFEIEKVILEEGSGFVWATDGYDAATDSYFWQYDGDEHYPQLTATYAIDGTDVVFVINYVGISSSIGVHKVTAYISSATLNGEDVTDSFVLEAEKEYAIKAVSVTVDWDFTGAQTGTDENGGTYYFWQYDGKAHAPKAYLADADGNRIKADNGDDVELTVYGAEINARTKAYVATAVLPADCDFADGNAATHEYYITKATIEVNWVLDGATKDTDGDGNDYYYWTYGDDVTPKAYIKLTDGTNGTELQVTGVETDAGTHTLNVMQSDGNYEFKTEADATQKYVIKPMTVTVKWYGVDGSETDFKWTYVDGDTLIAPTAYLAYIDDGGDLQLIKDGNGENIKVDVSGAANEIGPHTAQAVDTFVNYDFASVLTKEFEILAKDLADNNFAWTAEGAEKSDDGLTFTYEYTGENNLPVPSADVEDLEFNTVIKNAAGDTVLVITEVGTYTVTATSRDVNYAIPDGLKTITVIVTPKTVEVEWDKSELIYNGENQMPKAYYTDVTGNKVELTVTVGGDSRNAGEPYTATATLSSTNYVLKAETVDCTFTIAPKELKVNWTGVEGSADNFAWTYDGDRHIPLPEIVATEIADILVVYEITDKDGIVVASDGQKVKSAGEYTMTVKLEGLAANNYKLGEAEKSFTIEKAALTIKAGDKTVTYGDSLTLTLDDCTITGLIESEAEGIKNDLTGVLRQWLNCSYIPTTVPGTYTIYVDASWLNEYLANYVVTGENGTLTVKAAAGELMWQGDTANGPDFVYSGTTSIPKAFYYDANGVKHFLDVKYASYNEATGEYAVITEEGYEAVNVGTYYAVIVDADGNIVKGTETYTFANYGVKFEITKRAITVTVNELTFVYGEITLDNLAEMLGWDKGWIYGDMKPVQGDSLEITLSIDGRDSGDGYIASGTYAITVTWNETDFGDNYEVTVEGATTLTVENAKIEVNYDKQDENVYDAYGIIEGSNGYISDFVTNTKDFLTIAGYQGAAVTAYFNLVDENDYAPEDDRYTGDVPAGLTAEGEYLFNFMIKVNNHDTLYGRLLVKVSYAEYYLYVTVDGSKTFTKTYGYETAEDLAGYLFEESYATYDESINRVIPKETFLEWVTAKVVDADGNEVSGKLKVGTYKVIFALNENADARYSIYKATSRYVAMEITKYVLDIDWGDEANLSYVYDGTAHIPTITVAGITDENGNPVNLKLGENEITVNGEKVKVLVTVDGDFTAAGGHSILITAESDNFEISEEAALRSVSITEPAVEVPVEGEGGGLDDWKKWAIIGAAIVLGLIILGIIIAAVKRRKASDEDGFYDPVDESDL